MAVPEEAPDDVCGFVLNPADLPDVDESEVDDVDPSASDRWFERVGTACCLRDPWRDGRCIWHADAADKPGDVLAAARADDPECLDGARLEGVEVTDAVRFRGCGLVGARITDARLAGAEFADSDLRRAAVTDSDLPDVTVTDSDLRRATVVDSDLSDATVVDSDLPDASFERCDLSDATVSDCNLPDAAVADCNLRRVVFSDSDLPDVTFADSDLIGAAFVADADLSGATVSDTDLIGATVADSDLSDVTVADSYLWDATFRNADLPGATFRNTDLPDATFADSYLRDAAFVDSYLRRATFRDLLAPPDELVRCTLEDADVADEDLSGVDLSGSKLHDADLRNVRINAATAFGGTCAYEAEADRAAEAADRDVAREEKPASAGEASGRLDAVATAGRRFVRRARGRTDDDERLDKAVSVYRHYQQLLRQNGVPDGAGAYAVREKHARRKRALAAGDPTGWLKLASARWVMLYGESPWRVGYTSLAVILVSAFLYPLVGGTTSHRGGPTYAYTASDLLALSPSPDAVVATFLRNVYFSAVTFTTLGYGDVRPATPAARTLASVESLLGAALIAMLVAVLARTVTR